jgi:hypothetical protein
VEDQLTTESLMNKLKEEYFSNIEKAVNGSINISELPNWGKADASIQNKLQFVLRRMNLSKSLVDEEVAKRVTTANENYELNSLRLYLLLTCVNTLGEVSRIESPLTFLSWLDTSNSVTIRSIREEAINKAINSIGFVDDQKKAVKLIKSVFAQYRLNNSIESNFFSFFTDAIDGDTQSWISGNCWVYQDNPLEKWSNLQNVKEGYSNITTPENKRLTNARKRWDALESYQRLFEISQFVESLFNQYNLCQTNPPVRPDKDPIAKVWRDIDVAVSEYKVNYLSNSLFNHLAADGQKFKFNEVRCVFKDEELIVFEGDVREKDREMWLKRLSEWLKTKIDSGNTAGETIFLSAKNQALVIAENNFAASLEKWIDKGIKNILSKQ